MKARIAALLLSCIALLALSVTPAMAWWQFVAWGPGGERKVYSRYPTQKACEEVLKRVDAELGKKYPNLFPRVGSCEEYR
jgi:hypothetical protein